MDFELGWKRSPRLFHRRAVHGVLALILFEVAASVINIEPSLSNGIEPFDKLGEPGLAGNDKDLFEHD
jgi:hypothetical protein